MMMMMMIDDDDNDDEDDDDIDDRYAIMINVIMIIGCDLIHDSQW